MTESGPCPLCGADAERERDPARDTHAITCAACGYFQALGDLAQFDPLTATERRYIAGMNRNLNRYNCHCRYRDGARRYLRDFATVERVARAYGFADAAIEASGGCEGKTFIIDDDRRYTLRLYPDVYDRIRSELDWLASLRGAGVGALVPAPTPGGGDILAVDDPANPERPYAVLYHWIEGIPLQLLSAAEQAPLLGGLGEFVGRMHRHGHAYSPPESFAAPAGDIGAVRRHIAASDDAKAEAVGDRLLPLLAGLGAAAYGIVHNDLTGLNILCHGDGFSAIDWAGFRWGYFVGDISRLFLDGLGEDQCAAFIEGYRRVHPLPDIFVEHVELFKAACDIQLI